MGTNLFTNLKKVFRVIMLRNKVFGRLGKNNKFEWSVYMNENAEMGNNNYIGPYVMINNAIIGNYYSIGPSVKLGQGKHSLKFITTYQKISEKIIKHSLNTTPTIIGNDVWIGANAVIMQDVKIGNGAVIGANSVVTKDVPDYAIVVGAPAKVIKFRFTKERIKKIKESSWYTLEYNQAIQTIRRLEGEN